MQSDPLIIEMFNDVLTAELTAINQYFIHGKMCSNWGYRRLADHIVHESIDEMKLADVIIERILFLDGLPNLQRLSTVRVGETVVEQMQLDLELERVARTRLN
jgi:bacterioferritin